MFNKDPNNYIKLELLKFGAIYFEDKSKFNYSGDEIEMKNQIEKINKDDGGYMN